MKNLFITILLLLTFSSFSQIQIIDSIPADGILLQSGWKYHTGNNIDWAQPGFDDTHWKAVDATSDIHYIPEIFSEKRGWFRIRFYIDKGLLNKPLAFKIYQSLASEVYLNGNPLISYGKIEDAKNEVAAFRPNNIPNGIIFNQSEQVLAIKFGVQNNLPYTSTTHPYYAFRFRIYSVNNADSDNETGHKYPLQNASLGSIFFMLFLIHLGIYIKHRHRKADLYFSLAMLSSTFSNAIFLLLIGGGLTLSFVTYAFLIDWILLIPAYNFLLFMAIKNLFHYRMKYISRIVFFISLAGILFFIINYKYGQNIGILIPFYITTFISLILAIKAFKANKKDAGIIVIGIGIYFLIYSSFILFYTGLIPDTLIGLGSYSLTDALYSIGILSVPAVLSLYLSRDFATTSKKLESKLKEVQLLSEKTLLQEKEKQEILATQNEQLEQQVTKRTAELNASLNNLKSTQAQLIQSEKMASLGELTAGIAHEIQNPLNFVNNFSEVNTELIDELKTELTTGNTQQAIELANDIKENEQKINHHGKRADAIVKGMLQHSRSSSGVKEPTDINALCDEYLRLSYHGLRAKDKSFNAIMKTDFDSSIEKINIIQQDIGRVVLNLLTNAFYAVTEKKKQSGNDYEPTVAIATSSIQPLQSLSKEGGRSIQIKVSDNGGGIPQKVMDKIFQPFFTTKPTGQGTGLGLSLSYDIIKAHGGELKAETKEGEYAEFIIILPI